MVVALQESHNQLRKEVKDLQTVISLLQIENAGLKNQLKTAHSLLENEATLFHTTIL